jgi:hypothetical protein
MMGGMTTELSQWVDISTGVAAAAALWALGFAWLTYFMSVLQKNEDEFQALKSIVNGLRVELELMGGWAGAGGQGYSKTLKVFPADWAEPSRLIWRFDTEAISQLTNSPFLYRLGDIVQPFTRLNFSVSRLFQFYGEYRRFVNSDPGITSSKPGDGTHYRAIVFEFNRKMHIELIGGVDSDDPHCLYKAYNDATTALTKFSDGLSRRKSPWWFWFGHVCSVAFVVFGLFLLCVLLYRILHNTAIGVLDVRDFIAR